MSLTWRLGFLRRWFLGWCNLRGEEWALQRTGEEDQTPHRRGRDNRRHGNSAVRSPQSASPSALKYWKGFVLPNWTCSDVTQTVNNAISRMGIFIFYNSWLSDDYVSCHIQRFALNMIELVYTHLKTTINSVNAERENVKWMCVCVLYLSVIVSLNCMFRNKLAKKWPALMGWVCLSPSLRQFIILYDDL